MPSEKKKTSITDIIIITFKIVFFAFGGFCALFLISAISASILDSLLIVFGFQPIFNTFLGLLVVAVFWIIIAVQWWLKYKKEIDEKIKHIKLLTPEQIKIERENEKSEKLKREAEKRHSLDMIERGLIKRWYVRYLLAAIAIGFSIYIYTLDQNEWVLSLLLFIVAAFLSYELIGIILIIILIYWSITFIAVLPISIAIIIGAIVIALAIRRNRPK